MFQSLKCLKYVANKGKYIYKIVDTCFVCEVFAVLAHGAICAAAIIYEYSRRNLNVVKNLTLYYQWLEKEFRYGFDLKRLVNDHKYYLDKYYPQLEFGKRYYKCILIELNNLNF